MERDLIMRKLDSLARCVERIEEKRPATLQSLIQDVDTQDIVSLNLERAVQISVDIGAHLITDLSVSPPGTMGEVFTILAAHKVISEESSSALRRAVGFRNLSVHAYENIDWERVFDILNNRMADFREFAAAVMRHIDHKEE